MMRTILLLLLSAVVCHSHAIAQEKAIDYPQIGQSCPDFVIHNVPDDADSVLSKTYFDGRFFILAFWSKYCSGSAASFPVIDSLQQEFKNQVMFFLIGNEDKEERMRPMYKAIRERLNLTVPFAFDSLLFKKLVPGPVPAFVWIDNKGVVQAVTGSLALTSENVSFIPAWGALRILRP
ncbi:MAG: thioredoxin-like domain-containing protein [Cyclobacteriaceae bacterium]